MLLVTEFLISPFQIDNPMFAVLQFISLFVKLFTSVKMLRQYGAHFRNFNHIFTSLYAWTTEISTKKSANLKSIRCLQQRPTNYFFPFIRHQEDETNIPRLMKFCDDNVHFGIPSSTVMSPRFAGHIKILISRCSA